MTTFIARLTQDLVTDPPTPATLARWAEQYPVLDRPVEQLVAVAGTPRHQISDAVAGPLLALARGGDRHAARVLVTAIAPQLARTARAGTHSRNERTVDDELVSLVGHLWEAVVTDTTRPTVAFTDQLRRTAQRHQHTKRDRRRQASLVCRPPELVDREDPQRVDDLVIDRVDTITRLTDQLQRTEPRARRRLLVAVFPELDAHLARPARRRPRRATSRQRRRGVPEVGRPAA